MAARTHARFTQCRRTYHDALLRNVFRIDKGVPSNADKSNRASKELALGIFQRIGTATAGTKLKGQTAGNEFELATAAFVRESFGLLRHLRPGEWIVSKVGEKDPGPAGPAGKQAGKESRPVKIEDFEQYRHLVSIAKAAKENAELAASLGSDYIIKPDVVVFRLPVGDGEINREGILVDSEVARMSSLRKANGGAPLLHASISCKLTIRSDRSQNSRSEALNLIRNRRGNLPHVAVVTAEPMPSRLASVALGSGDIDCVYHFALQELQATVRDLGMADAEESLHIMVQGRRLKDIADLPLDLAV